MSEQSNHLISEKSPYLIQHVHNPVDWYPWGDEAFKRARKEDKPVFLSIGYSTCHWCHVMARESFEDREVAAILNKYFVSIKVDREERPEVDNTYMQVCQTMTGTGGWPLSIFMTHEKKPFFTGTYFPKEKKWGRPGFKEILLQISSLWTRDRAKILQVSNSIIAFHAQIRRKKTDVLGEKKAQDTFNHLEKSFDQSYGGFGFAPKFPTPHFYTFLLRYYNRRGEERALHMVRKSLLAMRFGGIYDHLGSGFHRYSTDSRFLVPHFEKMLYDQANLLHVYLEAYQVMKEDIFRKTAENIISYVAREMLAPEGAYYSAESAESEGEEGRFYTFLRKEIFDTLGKERGKLISKLFNIKEEGNYYEETSRALTGRNIFYLNEDIPVKLKPQVQESLKKLFDYRETREKPAKDDKIITAWNGLMISSLAKAGGTFTQTGYIKLAERASRFIQESLYVKNRLLRRYRSGESRIKGYCDDYAFYALGLINLFQVTQKKDYLKFALKLSREMIELFWDEKEDGFFLNGRDSEKMIFESKEIFDGAFSSSNAVAAHILLTLSRMTQGSEMDHYAQRQLTFMSQYAAQNLTALTGFLSVYDDSLSPPREIVLVKDKNRKFLAFLNKLYMPNAIYTYPNSLLPWTESYRKSVEMPTVFICENFSCKSPLHTLKELEDALLK